MWEVQKSWGERAGSLERRAQQGSPSPAGLRVAPGWTLGSVPWNVSLFACHVHPEKKKCKMLWRERFDLFTVLLAGMKFNVWKGFM